MALIISTWLWGDKYSPAYVERLCAGVARHLAQPYAFKVFTPPADDPLVEIPGCLTRLRAFDPAWQAAQGILPGDRLVTLDLDLIVTGPLDPLFDSPHPFLILQGANSANPCPYNGSVWMLRAGYQPQVWSEFSLEAAARAPFYAFPDDQGWMAHKLPHEAGWRAGSSSGIYAYKKPGWPGGEALPKDARIVCFPGSRDPKDVARLDWVRRHWAA